MSEYRRDFREAQREYYWSLPRVLLGLTVASVLIGGAGYAINLASQPARIVSKTLDADNVIWNYEHFYNANANYTSRLSQVKQFKGLFDRETDSAERGRLRMEMAAMQQSCRDLANRYNADAAKLNRGLFRSKSLPETLEAGACE